MTFVIESIDLGYLRTLPILTCSWLPLSLHESENSSLPSDSDPGLFQFSLSLNSDSLKCSQRFSVQQDPPTVGDMHHGGHGGHRGWLGKDAWPT